VTAPSRDNPPGLIALIGARGSGKSSVARLLAQRLQWEAIDADAVLERRAGKSIKAIFADEGEAGFRDRETTVLGELCGLRNHVLATGGGVVLRSENRDLLRRAWVVWLTADVETLSRRLHADDTTAERRPSLTTGVLAGAPEEIAAVLRAREPLYRNCADCVVWTASRSLDDVVAEILSQRMWAQRGTQNGSNASFSLSD
jgi:shikimate kinase